MKKVNDKVVNCRITSEELKKLKKLSHSRSLSATLRLLILNLIEGNIVLPAPSLEKVEMK